MSSSDLSRQSPFVLRLGAYLGERFPVAQHGVLVVCYFGSNYVLASVLDRPADAVALGTAAIAGAATLFLFFFHLRVFDEHKDFAEDQQYHAERVLQRGLVTLRDLRVLGIIAIAIETLLAALGGSGAIVALGAAILYSLIMLKEFFARTWLKRHFVLYAASHMLVMPLLAAVAYGYATGRYFWDAPPWFWVFAAAGFFVGFGWEISRKVRSPEEEVDGVESYTKILGTHGAAWVLLVLRVIDAALACLVARRLGLGTWFYAVTAASVALCVFGVVRYRLRTNPRTAKQLSGYAALHLVVVNVALAAGLLSRSGVVWEAMR